MTDNVDEGPCEHDVNNLMYLDTFLTPHVSKPETLSIAQSLMLCKDCGKTTVVYTQVARGYAADGSIPVGLQDNLNELQEKKKVEAQADALYKQRVAAEREQSLQAQLAKMKEPPTKPAN